MKIYRFDFKNTPIINEETVLCLGFFDGVHLGHKSLIEEAKKYNYKTSVLTFSSSFKKDDKQITPLESKIRLFEELDVDNLFIVENSYDLKLLNADDFIELVLKKINPRLIVVGEDFKFGHMAKGNYELLNQYFNTIVKDLIPFKDNKISSSWIKKLIEDGEIELANGLMDRPYTVTSRIIKGLGNGQSKIGFRTINIDLDNYIVPKYGVYLVTLLTNNNAYKGIANVGVHPTIDMLDKPVIEVFVNEEINLSTNAASVIFHTFVREEKQFEDNDKLSKQIQKDLGEMYEFFK